MADTTHGTDVGLEELEELEGEELGPESYKDEQEDEEDAQPWNGLALLPERMDLIEMLKEVRGAGRKQITVLLLGKSGVGKSSLVNSLLGEAAVRVQAFKLQADTEITTAVTRQLAVGDPEVDGLRIKLIDTCGLEDPEAGDTVNYGALSKIAEEVHGVAVDAVLYVDRLDLYRLDPLDRAIIDAISQTFGRQIWRRTILAFTHANLPQTPPGTTYDSFVDGRIRLVRGAVRRPPLFRPPLPAVLVENSDACPRSPDSGRRVLPDGSEWLVGLVGEVVDTALAARRPYRFHPRLSSRPGQRFRWLLPLLVAAELLLYRRVVRPALSRSQRQVEAHEERMWAARRKQRAALGLHPPNRPGADEAWRLEQMYDVDD